MTIKCTCPCLDCTEGNHCGGQFWWPDEQIETEDGKVIEPELIGICEHLNWDDLFPDEHDPWNHGTLDIDDDEEEEE